MSPMRMCCHLVKRRATSKPNFTLFQRRAVWLGLKKVIAKPALLVNLVTLITRLLEYAFARVEAASVL